MKGERNMTIKQMKSHLQEEYARYHDSMMFNRNRDKDMYEAYYNKRNAI